MKNKIRLLRSRTIPRAQAAVAQTIRLNELGALAGIGSLLDLADLAGTGFSLTTAKRIPGFEADVQNLRGDFDKPSCDAGSIILQSSTARHRIV